MKRLLAPFCLIAALAAAPANAAVVTLLDNTSVSVSTNSYVDAGGTDWTAIVFTVGSTAYTLTNLEVLLRSSSTTINGGDLTVELFNGASGQPTGASLASKTVTGLTALSSGFTTADKTSMNLSTGSTAGSNWQLSASQQYALVFRSTNSNMRLVTLNPDTVLSPGSSGLTYDGRSFTVNSGSTWNGPFLSATPWMKLTGDTVGGPSSVPDAGPGPALALLLGGLGLRQWRRARRTGAAA
jgi:hypothetical protein